MGKVTPTNPEGRGRPKLLPEAGEAAGDRAKAQAQVINQQKLRCKTLAVSLAKGVRSLGQNPDPADLAKLTRAGQILQAMEKEVHDLGGQGHQVKAIIVIPYAPKTMEEWAKVASSALPDAIAPKPDPNAGRHIEAEIIGHAPPGQAAEDDGEHDD